MVQGKEGGNPQKALNRGEYTADAIVVIGAIALSVTYLGSIMPAVAIIAGLIVGLIIGIITEVYTSGDYGSVKKIAEQSETGAATTIISGLAVGMQSTAIPLVPICVGIFVAHKCCGLYGIALAAVVCFPQQVSQLPLMLTVLSLIMPVVSQKCLTLMNPFVKSLTP